MGTFRRIGEIVEGEQFVPENDAQRQVFGIYEGAVVNEEQTYWIESSLTLDTSTRVRPGDWLLTDVYDTRFHYPDDIFRTLFEPVE